MGGTAEGETQMKRVGTLLLRAFVGALLLLAVAAGTASADPGLGAPGADGGSGKFLLLPEDPGLV
jgi:hypothetical protein